METLDIKSIRWGSPPVPVLPASLCSLWAKQPLPAWLTAECGLPEKSTIAALGAGFWAFQSFVSPRVQHYVEFLIKARTAGIDAIRLFGQPWPVGLELSDIPFSARAANALQAAGLLGNSEMFAEVTFGQLLRIPGLGIKSVVEISTLAETALDLHWRVTAELARGFAGEGAEAHEESAMVEQLTVPLTGSQEKVILIEGWRENLEAALREPWVDQIDEHDARFRSLFPPGYGTLEDRIDRAISDPASSSAEIPSLVESLPRIRSAVASLASEPLEESLLGLLGCHIGTETSRLTAIAARFGWLGDDPKTLQECGDMLGVTRERVRQIESKVLKGLTKHPIYLPKLDAALVVLERSAPTEISQGAKLLVEEGISRRPFSPRSVIDTAGILGRNTTLRIEEHSGEEIVVSGEQGQALGILLRTARKAAGKAGVASVYQVTDAIKEALGASASPNISEEDVRRLLQGRNECQFLDDDWFWFTDLPKGRNRLENLAKKVLSVASPQTIGNIREAVRRLYTWRASTKRYRALIVPPQSVLVRFFESHRAFRVDGEMVTSVKPLDYRKLLGDGEQTLVAVLRGASSGVLDRKTLVTECIARGINEHTLAVYTTYSPILEHTGLGLWQLRGVRVDPAAVEAVRQQNALRPRERRVQDFGWSSDGRLWVSWTLPARGAPPVLGIPAAVERYVSSRTFRGCAKGNERPVGNISTTDDGTSYGYGPFCRYSGADEGDLLRAEFNLSDSTVELSLNEKGSEELED